MLKIWDKNSFEVKYVHMLDSMAKSIDYMNEKLILGLRNGKI